MTGFWAWLGATAAIVAAVFSFAAMTMANDIHDDGVKCTQVVQEDPDAEG